MTAPLLVASTDVDRQLVVLTAEGPFVDAEHVDPLRLVLPAVPVGHALIVDLTGTTELGEVALDDLRAVAQDAAAVGLTMIIVCGDLDRRAELVVADLDTLVPVVGALEQAVPLTRNAA